MNTTSTQPPSPQWQQLQALAKKLWRAHLIGVNRQDACGYVLSIGSLTPAFVFLVVISCAIATLGLLLNSVAVIIGAMLVAPLMGPIVSLGFAVASTDIKLGIQAAKALLIGIVMALVTSYTIVKLSPFIAPTTEILARTQPNLFDLLVAVLSGLAGGYAIVRREIGTVAGVAIATALMPPLATAGYGLATGNQAIFNGAFLLFLVNMVAISFSATSMAIWYGFGSLHAPRELVWKTLFGLLLMALLSIPLLRALNDAVSRTLTSKQIESILREEGAEKSWQLGQIATRSTGENALQIEALVFVPEIDLDAKKRVSKRMNAQLGKRVQLELNQVLLGDRKPLPTALAPARPLPAELTETEALQRYLKRFLAFPTTAVEIDTVSNALNIQVAPTYAWKLGELMMFEAHLARNLGQWKVALIPPLTALPEITFERGATTLDADNSRALKETGWALKRWQIQHVRLVSGASQAERRLDRRLPAKRAALVAASLKASGIESDIETLTKTTNSKIHVIPKAQAAP